MDLTDFPSTVLDFEARFPDERSFWVFLWEARWPNGFKCDRCASTKAYVVIERGLEECAGCGRQASVTSGTMFHRCRAELRTWFRAIHEFVIRKHGCNALNIHRIVGVSEPTAWRWLQKIREAMGRRPKALLTGDVEADETYVCGPEPGVFGRDRGAKKYISAAAVEVAGEGCGRARIAPVASAKAPDVQSFVADNVSERARVRTDGLPSYDGLDAVFDHRRFLRRLHRHRMCGEHATMSYSPYQSRNKGRVSRAPIRRACFVWIFVAAIVASAYFGWRDTNAGGMTRMTPRERGAKELLTFEQSLVSLADDRDAEISPATQRERARYVVNVIVQAVIPAESRHLFPPFDHPVVARFGGMGAFERLSIQLGNSRTKIADVDVDFFFQRDTEREIVGRVTADAKSGGDPIVAGTLSEALSFPSWCRVRNGINCAANCTYEWHVFALGCHVELSGGRPMNSEEIAAIDLVAAAIARFLQEESQTIDKVATILDR